LFVVPDFFVVDFDVVFVLLVAGLAGAFFAVVVVEDFFVVDVLVVFVFLVVGFCLLSDFVSSILVFSTFLEVAFLAGVFLVLLLVEEGFFFTVSVSFFVVALVDGFAGFAAKSSFALLAKFCFFVALFVLVFVGFLFL